MEKIYNNGKQSNQCFLSIGQVAQAVEHYTKQRCTTYMIHNYERFGLLEAPERSKGGFRLFSLQDVGRIVYIKQLQSEGLTLAEIRERMRQTNPSNFPCVELPEQIIDRRSQILDAAFKTFTQKGFSEATLQDIATEVGITAPAIYQYFRSKKDLFLSLPESQSYQRVYEELITPMAIKEDATLDDIRQALVDIGEAFLFIANANVETMRMYISEARRFPEIGISYVEKMIEPVEKIMSTYLDYYISMGLLRQIDSRAAAHAFFGMLLNSILANHLLFASNYLRRTNRQIASQSADLFLNGIRKI